MTYPRITIGFLPRERFVLAAESLTSLYEHTTVPFELVVVDLESSVAEHASATHVSLQCCGALQ